MSAISTAGVSVTIDGNLLVDRLSLSVEAGEWLGIIGPNGAGKTTLLRAIAGVLPYTGSVRVSNDDVAHMRTRARAQHIAYAPQEPLIPPGMTVREFVVLGRTPYIGYFNGDTSSDRAIVDETLHRLALTELSDRDISTLSGGERRRVVIAQTLAQRTPVVVLDEPTSALDIGHQQELLELIDTLRREDDLTVITTLHDLTLAAQYPDRLLLIDQGTAVATGTPSEILTQEIVEKYYSARVELIDIDGELVLIPRRRT